MKKLLIILTTSLLTSQLFAQEATVLYSIYDAIEGTGKVGVPIVVFKNGKYSEPIYCEAYSKDQKEVQKCNQAKEQSLKYITSGSELYILNNGTQTGTINVTEPIWFGYSDWQLVSAKLPRNPNVSIITNNSKVGKNKLKEIKIKPTLKKRKNENYGGFYENKLLTKVDIDLDGMPELIYQLETYEGHYYQIYTFKRGVWKKVYEGCYQGV